MSEPETIELRRYPSRKLYNKNSSSYVRLPEVAEMVRKGANVRVEDTETGEDVTRAVLLQIIMEQEGHATGAMLSADLMMDMIRLHQAKASEMMTGLFELFGEHIAPVKLRHSNLSYRRLVSGAREYVLSQPDRVISVTDLCEALYVSRRTLQNAFRAVLGICPVNYLKALRLNAVRRTLRDRDSGFRTVQDVAARWGFWHMSQFAVDYRQLFGERPSETIKRRNA